jgi:hypothetical protein
MGQDWQVEWKKFFKKFKKAQEKFPLLRGMCREIFLIDWPEDQGFGSSDFNHSAFGEFSHCKSVDDIIQCAKDRFQEVV